MNRCKAFLVVPTMVFFLLVMACQSAPSPKPTGYFRIDFPAKTFVTYQSDCPFTFEYPAYGEIEIVKGNMIEPCWFNITFPNYKAKIHLTYKPLRNDLATHIEDVRMLVYKHIVKADDIVESLIISPEKDVYGMIYNLAGNTAASASFFLTDSTNHFLMGSLYFSAHPNKDSLAPVLKFFEEDIVHLTQTLTWK